MAQVSPINAAVILRGFIIIVNAVASESLQMQHAPALSGGYMMVGRQVRHGAKFSLPRSTPFAVLEPALRYPPNMFAFGGSKFDVKLAKQIIYACSQWMQMKSPVVVVIYELMLFGLVLFHTLGANLVSIVVVGSRMSSVQEHYNDVVISDGAADDDVENLEMLESLNDSATVGCATAPVSAEKEHKLRSDVWEYFDLVKCQDGTKKGVCKACRIGYKYDIQRGGTSSMKRHKCLKRDSQDIGQMMLTAKNGQLSSRVRTIDQMKLRCLFTALLIARNVPFSLVEWKEFRDICRMCLTSDMWTSVTTTGYISLTVHFLDQNWELKKYLLNFCELPPPHTGEHLSDKLFSMIDDWGIEDKVSNITLDNAANNGACARIMQSRLVAKKILFNKGKYFHVRCCAHILALIVKDGLVKIDPAILKIRKSVKALKKSQVRKQKFLDIVNTLGMSAIRRGIRQDVKTRWNSTYLMLDSCLVYKSVFAHLKEVDPDYKDCPTDEEWEQIEVVTKFLKTFYDLTTLFSGSKYPTSNLYFEGVCQVQVLLKKESTNEIEYIRDMVKEMQIKFNSYWENLSPILAMALVLDPRLKLKYLNFAYSKLYTDVRQLERKVDDVREDMKKLYNEYYTLSNSRAYVTGTQNMLFQNGGNSTLTGSEWLQEYAATQESGGDMQSDLSELDLYLSEKYGCSLDKPFDILMYWKAHEHRFPVLSRMAGDILSIHISTVASESAFSIGGRVIDRFRSSLLPENAEAVITTRDWIYGIGKEDLDEDNGISGEDVLGFELGVVEDGAVEDGDILIE
ncbi:zinc finger BED domain-containing protein RICESLEEPER 1-like [Papaver somniferum]|uniref:zinc finger BED domain-containing protein RICESLEEPER 1-like n=1 Tax=Papaver somniferum TaxID=3469 RepID=UPI000E704435|nr:zinc finger BED domain-containing protein RICESLEEPER 1-like [Papaver somniferum]